MEAPSSSAVQQHNFKAPEGKYYLQGEKCYGTVPFNYQCSTRLTLAALPEGTYILYNVGEFVYYFKHREDSMRKEPRAMLFSSGSSSKPAAPTCHAFMASKEGPDLLVGLFDGSVELLSLRAQLKLPPTVTKPLTAASVAPEAEQEGARCTSVAWIPKSEGNLFAVACASGCIYIYKKATVIGESTSKFLSLKSSNKNPGPVSSVSLGTSITDIAPSPDGIKLAVACRDGILRLLDIATGAIVGGFQSYFGAVLCCTYSADGRYVAAGAEDDLVTVYDVQEKCPIAHCEGHRSWVSSVKFDPWAQLASGEVGIAGTIYRLASVGQDAHMCLWEVQALLDGDFSSPPPNMRKSGSQATLQTAGWQNSESFVSNIAPGTPKGVKGIPCISPSPPRADLLVYEPLLEKKLHQEPLCDVLVSDTVIYTADHTGCIKAWLRPGLKGAEASSREAGPRGASAANSPSVRR